MHCSDCKKDVETYLVPDISKLIMTKNDPNDRYAVNVKCPATFACCECNGQNVSIEYITVTIKLPFCECGASKIGSQTHSDWCPEFRSSND
jgi:hypothetical protein